MSHPSIDVSFGDTYVVELVHLFLILRRHSGEELAITLDADGSIIACISDFGMDMEQDLSDEELRSIKRLANKRAVDYS
jgi:hypothetical protein